MGFQANFFNTKNTIKNAISVQNSNPNEGVNNSIIVNLII
jgi:hypothetical protein